MSADHIVGPAPTPLLDRTHPAITWSAIWAGAVVAVASSLLLSLAAAGLGFETGPPSVVTRASLKAFEPEIGAIAVAIQVLSAALGGYVAGRTRTIWTGLHDDESHFRDTAHGLVAWAVATVAGVLLAVLVLAPYAEGLAAAAAPAPLASAADALRAANIASQAALFIAIGMLLSAFVSAIAARIGGLRHEEMHARPRA